MIPKLSLSNLKKNPAEDDRIDLVKDPEISQHTSTYYIAPENIKKLEEIGRGSQARVYKALLKPADTQIALKELMIDTQQDLKLLKNELLILSACQHPNLVRCYGFNTANNKIQIALEYMNVGKLNYLVECEGALPEPIVSLLALQAARGLHYLHHERKVLHRDIKPSNMLLNSLGELKIADFGVSRKVVGTEGKANTYIGTKLYMAPERLRKDEGYQLSVDVWSLGLVVYECALGAFPCLDQIKAMGLLENEFEEFLNKGAFLKFPQKFSADLKDFLSRCLQVKPSNRAKTSELLEHPLLKKAENISLDMFKVWLKIAIEKKKKKIESSRNV